MTRNRKKTESPADVAAPAKSKNKSHWKSDDNNTQTFTDKETGRHYVALRLDDGSYSVTVCGNETGSVLYTTRVNNDADLDSLIGV